MLTQGDNLSNVFHIRVFETTNNIPTEIDYSKVTSATITFKQANNILIQKILKFDEINKYYYELEDEVLQISGGVIANVQLLGTADERLSTNYFVFSVLKDNVDNSSYTNTNEFPIIKQMEKEIEVLLAEANKIRTLAQSAIDKVDAVNLEGWIVTANTSKDNLETVMAAANTSAANLDKWVLIANASKENLDSSVSVASASKTALNTSVTTANTARTALDTSAATAGVSKTNLESVISTANTSKTALNTSVETAGVSKTALDSSISIATTSKTALDGSIVTANTAKTALQEVIDTADNATYASKISVDAKQDIPTGSNTAFGLNALSKIWSNNRNTAYGAYSLLYETSGNGNVAIGTYALTYKQDGTNSFGLNNCIGVGDSTKVSGNNQVQLGDQLTTTFTYGAVQNRSDMRDKTDIQDTILGLDFIKALRPVEFKWDYRESYLEEVINEDGTIKINALPKDGSKKRNRLHQGFIAQEVKQIMDTQGIDFAGYQDHSTLGGCDVLSLGYSEFIAPIVKAMQQQQKLIEELRKEIELLKLK